MAKISLTYSESIDCPLRFLLGSPGVSVTKREFEAAVKNDVQKISSSLNDCLIQAQVKHADIGLVILTGGSTEIPIIQSSIEAMFPHAEFSQGNKMDSVGLGLAIEAW